MDYKQNGPDGKDLLSACFVNTTCRRGQVVDQHSRYLKPACCTPKEIQELYQTQNAIIGSVMDRSIYRVFIEIIAFVPQGMEVLTEYDLNNFCVNPLSGFLPYKVAGFPTWSDNDKAQWGLQKAMDDPHNMGNLAIAIIDMVRRDLAHIAGYDDDDYHSSWFRLFMDLMKHEYLPDDYAYKAARDRRDHSGVVGQELFYYLDRCQDPMWGILQHLETTITEWIYTQWLELRLLFEGDSLHHVPERDPHWSANAFSTGWWRRLSRLDGLNEQRSRRFYVSSLLGDVRDLDDYNMPFGMEAPTAHV
jgi:hypothetical protein